MTMDYDRVIRELIERVNADRENFTKAHNENVLAIQSLKKRLAEIEKRKVFPYLGTWKGDVEYPEGYFVTHAGGIWHSNAPTTGERPGSGPGWVLAVKSGART